MDTTLIIVAGVGAGGWGALIFTLLQRGKIDDRLWTRDAESAVVKDRVAQAEARLRLKIDVVEVKVDNVEHKVDVVHEDIKTGNALTMGQLLGDQETRRIVQKQDDAEKLTTAEEEHLADVPPKEDA